MPLTPEEAQQVSDLRSRMLGNIQAGRTPWENFSKEEIKLGLESLRGGRARAAESMAKGRKTKATAPAGPEPDMADLLKSFGLEGKV